jgi:5-methylcytosine-specific restriction endonuclease McrA
MSTRYELEPLHRNTPDEEFLGDLKRVATELVAASVTITQYNKLGRFHASSLQRRFGSWHRSLERAGLAVTRNVNVTEVELFGNLVEVWAHLGRQPRYADLESDISRISPDTYKRRYGGWRRALESFVRWANESDAPVASPGVAPAGKKHQTPRSINYRLRFLVIRRDNFRCRLTGRSPATDPSVILEVDHIYPWEQGGETVLENLQTLAKDINIGKSNLSMHHDG